MTFKRIAKVSFHRSLQVLAIGLIATLASASVEKPEPPALFEATAPQIKAGGLATALLSRHHYIDVSIDEALSSAVLDDFIEKLDPNRMFFLQDDIEAFERHRERLDGALKASDLRPAFGIFNIYQTRVAERVQDALYWIGQDFDFDEDETYEMDRSEQPWAKNAEEARELWRLRIKNDKLNLHLGEQDEEQIQEILERRYEGLGNRVSELNSDDAFELFMNAFGNAIEPHTGYMAPRTSENFRISMQLSLEGIGAVLSRQGEHTTIQRVVPGGPAHQDGTLGQGDRIVGVAQGEDGEMVNVVGWRLDDVVELIRGPKDSTVRLEFLPSATGLGGPMESVELVRNEVKLEEQAAQKRVIELPADNGEDSLNLGIIRVPTFYLDFAGRARGEPDYRSTTRDVAKLIETLNEQQVDGIILDLRNNGGGSLDEATSLTGLFIDRGPVVQVRNSADHVQVERSRTPGPAWDGPLAVMVNRNSASASEIFAAAIQDYGRGIIVGEQTYGKGTVQNLIDLDRYRRGSEEPMGQLRVTTAQFFRINGGSTQHRGVMPDIKFPSEADPAEYGESRHSNALPWTEIEPVSFDRWSDLSMAIDDARTRHEQRRDDSEEFGDLIRDLDRLRELRQRTHVSLRESTRREEMEKQRELREARQQAVGVGSMSEPCDPDDTECQEEQAAQAEDDNQVPDPDNDLLLKETSHILADLITFHSQRLAKSATTEKDDG